MSSWSPLQREWLRALGHPVLVLAGNETGPSVAEVGEPPAVQEAERRRPDMHGGPVETAQLRRDAPADPAAPGPAERPHPAPAAPGREVDRETDGPAAPRVPESQAATPAAVRTDIATKAAALAAARRGANERAAAEALREALVRATGLGPGAGARRLRELGADPLALRSDPAAKRALWTRLRQIRKDARK